MKFRHGTPKYHTFLYELFWAEGTWKNANAGRGFLWTSSICLKTDPPKGPNCYKSPPRTSINQKCWPTTREWTRSWPHPGKLCHKLLFFLDIFLKVHLSFLIIIYSLLNCLHPLLPIRTLDKLQNLSTCWRNSYLTMWYPCACDIKH